MLADGAQREGGTCVYRRGTVSLPLYEAKVMHHYDHRWGSYARAGVEFITKRVLDLACTRHGLALVARDLGYDGPPFAWDPTAGHGCGLNSTPGTASRAANCAECRSPPAPSSTTSRTARI